MVFSGRIVCFLWFIIAALFFIPFLGNVHLFDWDEINFAEISREMYLSGNYGEPQINFRPFTEKPPLFFWLQAISMKIFGANEFAARFPNALLGVMVMPLIYSVGKKIRDHKFGILWSLVYFGTILPHLYFKSGIIDPWFNLFIFSSLYCLIESAWKKQDNRGATGWIIPGGIFLGLAILTKGPVALVIIGLVFLIYWASRKFRSFIPFSSVLLFGIVAVLVTGLWFGINYLQRGDQFIIEFTIRQWELLTTGDAGHEGFLFYHFVVILFGCFPASIFLVNSFLQKDNTEGKFRDLKKWMNILFWVVLILFTLVKTKIAHYSSLCYYPLSFLAAANLYAIVYQEGKMKKWMKVSLVVTALPFILGPIVMGYFGNHIDKLAPFVKKDPFALENLEAQVAWSGWEFLPGLLLAIVITGSLLYFRARKNKHAVYFLFIGTAVYLQVALFFFIKRIEGYSQRANIEFWETHASEDCYMTTYGYKSYTQYFYGKARAHENKNYINIGWLLHGAIDKPVYISAKPTNKDLLGKDVPDAVFLYKKNGFYFYRRDPAFK